MKYNFLYEGAISRSVKNAASELKTKQAKTLMGGLNKIKNAIHGSHTSRLLSLKRNYPDIAQLLFKYMNGKPLIYNGKELVLSDSQKNFLSNIVKNIVDFNNIDFVKNVSKESLDQFRMSLHKGAGIGAKWGYKIGDKTGVATPIILGSVGKYSFGSEGLNANIGKMAEILAQSTTDTVANTAGQLAGIASKISPKLGATIEFIQNAPGLSTATATKLLFALTTRAAGLDSYLGRVIGKYGGMVSGGLISAPKGIFDGTKNIIKHWKNPMPSKVPNITPISSTHKMSASEFNKYLIDIYNEASAIEKKSLKGVFGKIKDALTELGSQPKM